jgi:hypothetical protein
MCIFSGRVQHVGGTRIFARLSPEPAGGTSQYLVYSMNVSADRDVAMILPLPVSGHEEGAVKFIALDAYPEFFRDVEEGFPRWRGLVSKGIPAAAGGRQALEVHEVGDFIARFVPTQADFDRLDARFRLPAATWEQLPQYGDWGFAVFQLKGTSATTPGAVGKTRRIHPMAFRFPTRLDEALYFPTLHIHDGRVNARAEFDHALYFQGEQFREFADEISGAEAVAFMKVEKAKGIVQPDAVCGKRRIVGTNSNRDTLATGKSWRAILRGKRVLRTGNYVAVEGDGAGGGPAAVRRSWRHRSSLLPYPREQSVPHPLRVLLVARQLGPQGLVFPPGPQDEQQTKNADGQQRPHGTQAQGDARKPWHGGDVAGVPHDGVGAGVDDLMATLRLDANRPLGKFVHGPGPDAQPEGEQKQDVADRTAPPGDGEPVKTSAVQGRHDENRNQRRDHEANQNLVPAFRKAEAAPGYQEIRIHMPEVRDEHQSHGKGNEQQQPSLPPVERSSHDEQKHADDQ